MYYNNEDKAKIGIVYAINKAIEVGKTTTDGVNAFNSCASQLGSCTLAEFKTSIDGELL